MRVLSQEKIPVSEPPAHGHHQNPSEVHTHASQAEQRENPFMKTIQYFHNFGLIRGINTLNKKNSLLITSLKINHPVHLYQVGMNLDPVKQVYMRKDLTRKLIRIGHLDSKGQTTDNVLLVKDQRGVLACRVDFENMKIHFQEVPALKGMLNWYPVDSGLVSTQDGLRVEDNSKNMMAGTDCMVAVYLERNLISLLDFSNGVGPQMREIDRHEIPVQEKILLSSYSNNLLATVHKGNVLSLRRVRNTSPNPENKIQDETFSQLSEPRVTPVEKFVKFTSEVKDLVVFLDHIVV